MYYCVIIGRTVESHSGNVGSYLIKKWKWSWKPYKKKMHTYLQWKTIVGSSVSCVEYCFYHFPVTSSDVEGNFNYLNFEYKFECFLNFIRLMYPGILKLHQCVRVIIVL